MPKLDFNFEPHAQDSVTVTAKVRVCNTRKRHRVTPSAELVRPRSHDRFIRAWKASAALKDPTLRESAVLAQLLNAQAKPTQMPLAAVMRADPAPRLYECPTLQDCLSVAATVGWAQMSCACCPTYRQGTQAGHNAQFLHALVASAASHRKG